MEWEKIPESVSEISIVFCDDAEIKELNSSYRGKDRATDVLSFSQLEGDSPIPPVSLGDIIISLETASRQASERDLTLEQEMLRLLIHGVLHLFGYDHENVSEEEAQEMEKLEDELFNIHQTLI